MWEIAIALLIGWLAFIIWRAGSLHNAKERLMVECTLCGRELPHDRHVICRNCVAEHGFSEEFDRQLHMQNRLRELAKKPGPIRDIVDALSKTIKASLEGR